MLLSQQYFVGVLPPHSSNSLYHKLLVWGLSLRPLFELINYNAVSPALIQGARASLQLP